MTNEQATELLALMADQLKATDRQTELFDKRFTQLTEVVLNGFVRLEDKFDKKTDILADEIRGTNQRVDTLTDRVDTLTDCVDTLTSHVDTLTSHVDTLTGEVREIKVEAQITNRRLSATFDQTGQLTEQANATALRISRVEQTQQPTNAELHQRLLAVENKLNKAS